jgi:hypothetical protein
MNRAVTLAGYAVIALAVVAAELAARRSHRLPTLGQALTALFDRPVVRVLATAAWLWVGWHVFTRHGP